MINEEQRNEVIESLTEEFKILYAAPASGETMYRAFKLVAIDEENYQQYATLIGDTILGFHQTTDLPRLFQKELGMGADESQHLLSELSDFLTPVIKRENESLNAKKEDLERLAKTFAETKGGPREIQPEGKPEDVKPLRTMEGDMNRIHGYGAYRAQETTKTIPEAAPAAKPTPAAAPAPTVSPTPAPTAPPNLPQAAPAAPPTPATPAPPTPTASAVPPTPAATVLSAPPAATGEPVYKAEDQSEILKQADTPRPQSFTPKSVSQAEANHALNISSKPITSGSSDPTPNNITVPQPAAAPPPPANTSADGSVQIPLRKVE